MSPEKLVVSEKLRPAEILFVNAPVVERLVSHADAGCLAFCKRLLLTDKAAFKLLWAMFIWETKRLLVAIRFASAFVEAELDAERTEELTKLVVASWLVATWIWPLTKLVPIKELVAALT